MDQFDPSTQNVDEVNAYLASATPDERARVLALEDGPDGKGRATVIREYDDGPSEDAEAEADAQADAARQAQAPRDATGLPQRDPEGRPLSTAGLTFQEAAQVAAPAERGYIGVSPEAERTGRRDKGLSQRNPAILTGGPVPDARPQVDDTAAIDSLHQEG